MFGAIYRYFVRSIILNLIFFFSVIGFEYYLNSEQLSHYSFIQFLFNIKKFILEYVLNSKLFSLYLLIFILVNIYLFVFWFIRYFKYLNLPYALGFFRNVKQLEGHEKKFRSSHDKFIKLQKVENGIELYFKNWVSISFDEYNHRKKEILQYLKYKGEITVHKWGMKGVKLSLYKLPKLIEACTIDIKKGFFNFGYGFKGNYYIPLSKLTHTLCVGETGSGKSNFMHYLIQSIFKNEDYIKTVELIDLKGTELYRYKNEKYMNFIDNIDDVKERLLSLKEIMNNRFEEMKHKNLQTFDGKYYLVFIDEIGTIGTNPNKKLKDEIFNLMIELFQKGRAAKILFFIFAQKIDSTNIPSNVLTNIPTNVLMRTDSDFNINNTIGKKEELERITTLDPDSFPKGRAIVKNGSNSEKVLLQVPFINFEK